MRRAQIHTIASDCILVVVIVYYRRRLLQLKCLEVQNKIGNRVIGFTLEVR